MSSAAKVRLAIFASGGGSNADQICLYFKDHPRIKPVLILTNRKQAGVTEIASQHRVPCHYIPKAVWTDAAYVSAVLSDAGVTHIVLAGFLLLIPAWLIDAYRGRIINIHPALLPKYGGHGMYGHHVHEAVRHANEKVSGITIHEVDEAYDEGDIIFQKEVALRDCDSATDIAKKVLAVEHYWYPRVIEKWVDGHTDEAF